MKRNSGAGLFWLLGASLSLGGCDGLSDVGKQDNDSTPPFAEVVVLNQPFSKDASSKVSTRVRSGTEVFLSGKDSDGVVAPVLSFRWQLLTSGAAAAGVDIVTRDKNTISFTAPPVAQDTVLQFRLTVTDSNGRTAQKDTDVTIVGVPDGDHFLTYDLDRTSARKIKLVPIASRNIAASELASDVEFEITVRRLVDYTTPGVDGPYLPMATEKLRGKWLATYGAGRACDDPRNPLFQISKPAIDVDDILATVDRAQAALEPNTALIDQYDLKLEISIAVVAGSLPADVEPRVCVPDVPAPSAPVMAKWGTAMAVQHAVETEPFATTLEIGLEQLMGDASEVADTPASARAYYATIDPRNERTTFLNWLKVNGYIASNRTSFNWTDVESGSHAHAIYTNNFDLGFGRDMYARIGPCSDAAAPALGQPIDIARVGRCDISAVVVNYSSLEAATKKLNPVLAVAMEYTATPNSAGRRIVQFYTYAPDLVSGQFTRVLSANLDGRGEKYMPQVCTACHGGTPGGMSNGVYANAGDVNASFLPWDLESFLFSDSTGANSDRSYTDQSFRAFYTRAAQAESLRRLNQIAYLTYHDATRPNRFVLAKELLEGWYGRQAGPPARAFINTTFDAQFVPPSWSANGSDGLAGTSDDNPASAATIYRNAFASYCRACHVAHVPPEPTGGESLCNLLTPRDGVVRPAVPNQLALACYRQFVAEPALANRLANGEMPFARLTMDRFWVAPAGGTSASNLLLTHLSQRQPPITVPMPGTPRTDFDYQGNIDANRPDLDIDSGVIMSIDPAKTKFADALQWTVERCPTGSTCVPVSVSGASSSSAYFVVPDLGTYNMRLTASAVPGSTAAPVVKTFSVIAQSPQIDQNQLPQTLQLGSTFAVSPVVTLGNGGRDRHRYWLTGMTSLRFAAGSPACTSAANACTLDQSVSLEASVTSLGSGAYTVNLNDVNGPAVTASRTVSLTSGLAPSTTAIVTSPNTDVSINFAENVSVPATERVEVQILSGPSASNGFGGSAQLLAVGAAATVLTRTYRPPARFANYDSGNVLRGSTEQINFRLLRRRLADNQIVEQRDFTREVRIRATTSFASNVIDQVLRRSSTYPSGGARCDSCHTQGGNAENVLRFDQDTTTVFNSVRDRVNLASPASSVIVCWPAQDCTTVHTGGDRDPGGAGGADDDLAPIRAWIDQGANNF